MNQNSCVLETASGRRLDLTHPLPAQISLIDIARGLSRCARFHGQTQGEQAYSTAEHNIWMSVYLYRRSGSAALAMHGLLHRAYRAYLGESLGTLDGAERLQEAILRAFAVMPADASISLHVREAERIASAREARALLHSGGKHGLLPALDADALRLDPRPVTAALAEQAFRGRFRVLRAVVNAERRP